MDALDGVYVAIAFFIAEMGDKTQLATVALAAKYQSSVAVWFGTNIGMLIADAIGIIIGFLLARVSQDKTTPEPEGLTKQFLLLIFFWSTALTMRPVLARADMGQTINIL